MPKEILHKNYCDKAEKIRQWFASKTLEKGFPIYSSYDIRDSGFKISNVDANIFPAGFNNICPTDKESSIEIMQEFLDGHYGVKAQKILLITEEHTQNPHYWENVATIKNLLEQAGRQVQIGFPRALEAPLTMTSTTGIQIPVLSGALDSQEVLSFKPDLVISNNDFSEAHAGWAEKLNLPMNPPRELGWYQRKKSRYFHHYNLLVEEFSDLCGIDPFTLNVATEAFTEFDVAEEGSRKLLAKKVDLMIERLQKTYSAKGIQEKPFVFVKNNSGTYGLAVIRVGSGSEVLEWNYKSKKKMKAAKGGRDVEEVIIQEGISSRIQADGASAEPVIYMIGCQLAGGFLRTHAEKNSTESLNSPGAVYKRLCVSDLNVSVEGSPLENVYGWSARLGLLAISEEAKEMGVDFRGFQASPCNHSLV
ncbi:MAG: glutamate--cysteine ligase [Pseudobdellovibrionaceae bacterium]